MVSLRETIRSTKPPMVSMPSDRGITSSSSRSPAVLLPASWLAWMAAPKATTSSGFRLVKGSLPKNSATARCTCGMRVEPPTMTTPCTSSRARCASRRARRTAAMERAVRSAVTASKSERLTSNCTEALDKSALNATKSVAVSASLHWRAAMRTADLSAGVTACCPTCCSTHSASAAS